MSLRTTSFLAVLALFIFSAQVSADVALTFDSDVEGFTMNGDGDSLSHSTTVGGGAMCMTASTNADGNGWNGNMAQMSIGSNAAFNAEFQDALANGGEICYDVIINEADVAFQTATDGSNPAWFQSVVIANSDDQAGGSVWDTESNNGLTGTGFTYGGTGQVTVTVTETIVAGLDETGNDGMMNWNDNSAWHNINLGLNWDGDDQGDPDDAFIISATVYIDNLTIKANPVPEPTTLSIIALVGLGLTIKRRR